MNAARHLAEYPADLFPDLAGTAPPPSHLVALAAPLSEIAPGVYASGLPSFEIPSHVLCRLVPAEGGNFTLAPEPWPGFVRMGDDIGRRLGVLGLSTTTLRRLIAGGFIDHIRPAPGCICISIESLMEHFERTRNDCAQAHSYWTAERCAEWRTIIDSSSNLED